MKSRREIGCPSRNDDPEWTTQVAQQHLSSPRIKSLTMELAESARCDGDPELHICDLEASANYLVTVLHSRSTTEIAAMSDHEIAAIWARGMLGAARYRVSHAPRRGSNGPPIRRERRP